MENILQSLVKIIIIGSLFKATPIGCNRQFLPPPLPYYPNGGHFVPGFAPPYHESVPIYYREENPPPPISYQNTNSYTLPQLFYQNENYNPLQLSSPAIRHTLPQFFPYKPNFHQPYKAQLKFNVGLSQGNFKKPSQVQAESHDRGTEAAQKKPAFFATNIIIKEENQPPYYNDEYSKNYHDEDYSDNYSDESPSQPDPCILNSPYRHFQPPKPDPTNPNTEEKFTLCNPHFQPNFGNSIYTVKMPITLLPSRFPPRVEQIIERIQNYFSTYTHQETPKPLNQTLTTTTVQPVTEASSEVVEQSNPTTENLNKKKANTTEENQQQNFEQANSNSSEAVTVLGENHPEQVTQKTVVAVIQTEKGEIPSTAAPDVQDTEELQMVKESTQIPNALTETLSVTTTSPQEEFPISEQQPKEELKGQAPKDVWNQNQTIAETVAERENQIVDVKMLNRTNESVDMNNRTEQVIPPKDESLQLNVTDSYS